MCMILNPIKTTNFSSLSLSLLVLQMMAGSASWKLNGGLRVMVGWLGKSLRGGGGGDPRVTLHFNSFKFRQ